MNLPYLWCFSPFIDVFFYFVWLLNLFFILPGCFSGSFPISPHELIFLWIFILFYSGRKCFQVPPQITLILYHIPDPLVSIGN